MKQLVSFRGISDIAHSSIEEQIRDLADHHLTRHLRPFPPELASLRARVEKNAQHAGDAYVVRLRLALPTTTLAVDEATDNVTTALKASFAELERQLERHTAHLLKADSWRRKARRDNLRRLKAALATGTPQASERFHDQVDKLSANLRRTVKRELAYLQARGDLSSDDPTLDDVIDETLARAFDRLRGTPSSPIDEATLHRLALSVLHDEAVRRRREEGEWVSLESKAPVSLAETLDEQDEQVLEFWQPDEKLRLEDTLPSAGSEPSEEVSERELRSLTAKLLCQLPNSWRRAVLLAQVDDLPAGAVAARLDTDEATVRRWLEMADAFLRARLEELGVAPVSKKSSSSPIGYIESGRSNAGCQ